MRISVRFPLGVYHAQSQGSPEEPEWPPHPVRLIGALVAAAHSAGRRAEHPEALEDDLELLNRICEAPAPVIGAPPIVTVTTAGRDGRDAVPLRGATRWAPRNYFTKGGRDQAAVQKVGVAIGDRPIHFDWPHLELERDEHQRLSRLAAEVSFLGTSRSPAIATVAGTTRESLELAFVPLDGDAPNAVRKLAVRVPDETTLAAFERRHQARRASKPRVEAATAAVPGVPVGIQRPYAAASEVERSRLAFDPGWWADMILLAIDRERSEVIPRSSASYLVGRALRTALLGAYDMPGTRGEAPPILRGRGGDPHCAFISLADIWHADATGEIKGVAILPPGGDRVDDLAQQRAQLEQGLATLVHDTAQGEGRFVQIPDSGRVWLRQPTPREASLKTLLKSTYCASAASWVSATPVVHARWRKRSTETLLDQVALDCSHVGLPTPARVEAIRGAALPAAAGRPVPPRRVPPGWRKSLGGPTNHLRIDFERPVTGPLLLGRARHFGLGLFVPA